MSGQRTAGAAPLDGDSPLLGVVLAGGRSSRMGVDKATLPHPHSGSSYLEHAIARLAPLVPRVAVSGRDWQGPGNVIGLPDAVAELGPAMGVATALRYAATQQLAGVLVTPVDMPDLASEHLQTLVRAWARGGGIVCASFAGGIAQPLLAIYPLAALAAVEQVVASPRRSLSQWVNCAEAQRVRLPAEVSKNVNRPGDR